MDYKVIGNREDYGSGCTFWMGTSGAWQLKGQVDVLQSGKIYKSCGAYLGVMVGDPILYMLNVRVSYEPRHPSPVLITVKATATNISNPKEQFDLEVVWQDDTLVFDDSPGNFGAFAKMNKYGTVLNNNVLSGLTLQQLEELLTQVPDEPVFL